jgi:enolase
MKNDKIKSIFAREILDSRGNPTVEVDLKTDSGVFTSSVPSGASTGINEAKEIRDGGERYHGKGVLKAVGNVNNIISKELEGEDVLNQEKIDNKMIEIDGTKDKSNLGANAILGVSMASMRAAAFLKGIPLYKYIADIFGNDSLFLPRPSFNILNGGAHAANNLDIQEFMIAPLENRFSESLRISSEVYHDLGKIIYEKYSSKGIGDEGGFAPPLENTKEALNLILESLKDYQKVGIAVDCAASQFFSDGKYNLDGSLFNREELIEYYESLIKDYPIFSFEDPFEEEDWDGFKDFNQKLGSRIQIIGDDILSTNPERIKKAHDLNCCNSLLLKLNQIGTLTEAIEAARLAKSFNWKIMVSHRSGETCDNFISDFAVGIGSEFIKSGAPARGERTSKYNRLLKIEEEIL